MNFVIRRNDLTEESVLYLARYGDKPRDFRRSGTRGGDRCRTTERVELDASCPFCPGNEYLCESAICEVGSPWIARCVPNKFPIFHEFGSGHEVSGKMEVIVAGRKHNACLAQLDEPEAVLVVSFWCQRYSILLNLPDTKHVAMFINHGVRAGGSLQHAHFQAVALSFVPASLAKLVRTQRTQTHCLLCREISNAQHEGRVVFQNDLVCAFTVVASRSGTVWIVPRRCRSRLSSSHREEINSLGIALRQVVYMSYHAFDDPDFNVAFYNAPVEEADDDQFHYYAVYVPHLLEDCSLATLQYGFAATDMSPEIVALALRRHRPS